MSFQIEIEPNRWQMVSIPIQYGYWDSNTHLHVHDGVTISTVKNYIIDQIEDIYAAPAGNMIEVINTYVGDVGRMWNYITGVTSDTSEHNFPLTYVDRTKLEHCGLLIKSIHGIPFVIKWGM